MESHDRSRSRFPSLRGCRSKHLQVRAAPRRHFPQEYCREPPRAEWWRWFTYGRTGRGERRTICTRRQERCALRHGPKASVRDQPRRPPQNSAEPMATELVRPSVHVMPMWEPRPPRDEAVTSVEAVAPAEATVACRSRRPTPTQVARLQTRRFADPFDPMDGGANCLRCGYLIEQARDLNSTMRVERVSFSSCAHRFSAA
jgi:hypothetical protein